NCAHRFGPSSLKPYHEEEEAMPRQNQRSKFIVREISRLVVIALVIGAVSALAQSPVPSPGSVPPTARQAATIPAVASRLSRPGASRGPASKHSSMQCSQMRPGSPQDDQIVYENGPVNGQVDAWTLNFGFVTTNSIQVNTSVTALNFYAWIIPGDTISNVQVSIGSAPYGSDLFNGVVSLTQANCSSNQFGYNVCVESGAIPNGPTLAGDAWITLQNANVPSGDPVYWDENSGVGCHSPGCPSQAQENTIGTIPSEAFTILGAATTITGPPPPPPCFHPEQELQVIHDFTPSEGGESGVTIDKAGNLYGLFGGDYGAGGVYELASRGQDWLFTPLYSFAGGSNGSSPSLVIVGPDGGLYGSAYGGIQNCGQDGNSYCGLIFRLRPSPVACPTVLCGWREEVLYRFSGGQDGQDPGNLTFDQAGNLYGIAAGGLIFELSPSPGGWTETVLYTFAGGSDGNPNSLVWARDGNLYGATQYGGDLNCSSLGCGTVFQLVPSGDSWTKNILYAFHDQREDGYQPSNIQLDSFGNLYGQAVIDASTCSHGAENDVGFKLTPSGGIWTYGTWSWFRAHGDNYFINNFRTDAVGDVSYTDSYWMWSFQWDPPDFYYQWASIDGWRITDWFYSSGALAVDDSSHLYGTTPGCGRYGKGTVWRFGP
ncbi:MAG: choice-of-anchor tandem repeat GloVer-containing protein, partial [Candidatus Korobacteraceae bacterium]